MYIRNDGKGESNITQNGFTAYLLSAVAHRKADYLHAKQRRQAREVLTDPDDLSTEEAPGISDPTDLLCCIENAALEEALNRISERDRYIFFSRALHGRSFHELALDQCAEWVEAIAHDGRVLSGCSLNFLLDSKGLSHSTGSIPSSPDHSCEIAVFRMIPCLRPKSLTDSQHGFQLLCLLLVHF